MVEAAFRDALKQPLGADAFSSVDSAPPKLSRKVPFSVAPKVLAVFTVVSFLAVFAIHRIPVVQDFFPEGDLYFSRYPGSYAIPLRLFLVSFFVAFATGIPARWSVKLRYMLDLNLHFFLVCGMLDLTNSLVMIATGKALPLDVVGIVSGLAGLLIFAQSLLKNADMPAPVSAPSHHRFKTISAFVVLVSIGLAGGFSIYVAQQNLGVVDWMRDWALLGGVSVGVFLFIPALFFLLNILAAVQALMRITPHYAPDISIIIPAFNEEHTIAAVLEAADAAAGRYKGRVTIIVIDNNSTDQTQVAARAAFAQCAHMECVLMEERQKGKAFALNSGLAAVRTEFFARIDADTVLDPDAIWRSFRHFGRPHVGAVGGLALAPGGGPFDGPRTVEIILKLGYDQVAFGAADCIFGVPGMFACYNTEAARLAGGFAHGMNGEDTDIALRIGEAGYRLVVDPSATFYSEVPRSFAHLREQRLRWFRSIFHVSARNRHVLRLRNLSVRGQVIMPFMLANTARRATSWPMLIFAAMFLILSPDPSSTIRLSSVVALLIGAPFVNTVIAIVVNLRFEALLDMPAYLVFRMLRAYLTLESMLSMTFDAYAARLEGQGHRPAGDSFFDAAGGAPKH